MRLKGKIFYIWSFLSNTYQLLAVCSYFILLYFLFSQFDVWEEDIWDCEQRAAPVPGQSFCVFPDQGACVFCDGVCSRRRPHDAHSCRCVFRATGHVSDKKVVLFRLLLSSLYQAHNIFFIHLLCFSIVAGFMQLVSSWGCSFYMSTRLYTGVWKNWWCFVVKTRCTSTEIEEQTGMTSFQTKSGRNEVYLEFVSGIWNSMLKWTFQKSSLLAGKCLQNSIGLRRLCNR